MLNVILTLPAPGTSSALTVTGLYPFPCLYLALCVVFLSDFSSFFSLLSSLPLGSLSYLVSASWILPWPLLLGLLLLPGLWSLSPLLVPFCLACFCLVPFSLGHST